MAARGPRERASTHICSCVLSKREDEAKSRGAGRAMSIRVLSVAWSARTVDIRNSIWRGRGRVRKFFLTKAIGSRLIIDRETAKLILYSEKKTVSM
jgi:hypothetical protein